MNARPVRLLRLSSLLFGGLVWLPTWSTLACGDKDDGGTDGGAADGGSPDGGGVDGGGADGGGVDGGGADGGGADGGGGDGGAATESDCDDGVDNDEDSLFDCEDPDCDLAEACHEQVCNDGDDDDGDGLTDCADPDCLGNPWCPELDCDNGDDDDGDGWADCLDADCLEAPNCADPELDCDDGIDDDEDGFTDCADGDCARAPGCYESECSDDEDDDGDGDIDCDDLDCFGELGCIETLCSDGADDDEDGATDCLDVDCWPTRDCLAACTDLDIGDATGTPVTTGSTAGADDSFFDVESCGVVGAADVGIIWEAPAQGCYIATTEGSSLDTVLREYETCRTEELSCNDDVDEDNSYSFLALSVDAGDLRAIVVDGASAGAEADWSLNIYEYEVPYDLDVGAVTGEAAVLGELDGLEDLTWLPSCAYYTEYDDLLLWTAPASGTWTFDLSESEFDTVLAVIAVGDVCPTELACNDDEDPHAKIYTSLLSVELEEGQQVVVWVGQFWGEELGDWQLDISLAE